MSKTKKITSIAFAIIFAFLTCGIGLLTFLPSYFNGKLAEDKATTKAAVDISGPIENSGLATEVYNGQTFYMISTEDEFASVAYAISYSNKTDWASANYALANDINLQSKLWTPIGTETNPFTGKFNGNGYTITGVMVPMSASVDQNYFGLFGKVVGATLYDVVIGEFTYSYQGDVMPPYSGRLAGYVENTRLVDIYDLAYVRFPEILATELKTFGYISTGTTMYAGDTFTSKGKVYSPANYNSNLGSVQFNWAGISGEPNIVGKSIYVVNDGVGKMYLFEDESKQDIGSYKILVEGTSVVDPLTRGVYSNNYRDELPKEAGSLGLTDGDVVIEGSTLGKKMMGFKNGMDKSENPTYYQNINEYLNGGDGKPAASTDYNFVVADWKDLSYNLTIHAGYNSTSGEEVVIPINDVLYGDTWANVIAQISRSGYTLKKLTETKGGTDAVYEAEIVWDENYINKTVTPTYPKGSNVTQWDEAGQNVLNIDLYAEWQGEPVNTLVKFQNTNDAGASLDAMNNLSVVYADPEVGKITISEYGSVNGEYTFKAVANEELNFSFKLDNGYVVSDNGVSITGGVDSVSGDAPIISYSYSEDTKIHTINVKGIVAEDAQITIEIEREEIAIPVTAQHFNLSLSGHDSATTSISTTGDGQYTITTKIGESFNLVATATGNYEFDTYQVNGLTQVNAPTGDTGAEKTFAITVETFNNPSIVISAKERLFTASIDFVYDIYNTDGNAKPGTISIQCGEQVVSTGEDASWSNLMVNDPVVITVTNNEYYVINDLTVSGGSAVLNRTSDTTWELTGVVGGETYTITANFDKVQYTATYTGGFAFSGNSPTPILDAEGSPVDDASQIITFGGKTSYIYGEELTLSFDLISQYYEFVGWYYSNGVLISSDPDSTLTAPASNLNIYGVIKGKTATVTINTGTYYELADEIKNANKNLVTVSNGVSTITFTYAQPNSGAFSLQTLAGYGVSRVLIGPSSANIANGESGFYLFGTGNSFAGYLSAYQNNAEILDLFTAESDWHIELLARPYSAQVVFQAGADATGAQVSDVYYYDQPIDVTTIMAGFSKTGHTGSGWEFTLSGTKYNVTDESLLSEGKYLLDFASFNGITSVVSENGANQIVVTRTYTANEYKLSFDLNGGTIADPSGLEGDAKTGYYKMVTYGQPIGSLPTATKTGYNWGRWTIDSSTVTADSTYSYAEAKTIVANFNEKRYDLVVYANGGKFAEGSDVSEDGTYINGELVYDSPLTGFFEGLASHTGLNRQGFKATGVAYVVKSTDGEGATYELKKHITEDMRFNIEDFGDTGFDFDDSSSVLTLYVVWEFAEDALAVNMTDSTIAYNSEDKLDFQVSVSFNGTSYNINETSSIPTDAGIAFDGDATWQYSTDGVSGWADFKGEANNYMVSISNVSESGHYRVTYTIKDTASISVIAPTKEISGEVVATIEKGKVKFEFSGMAEPPYIYSAMLVAKELISYNLPVLKMIETDESAIQSFINLNLENFNFGDVSQEEINSICKITFKTLLTQSLIDTSFKEEIKTAYANSGCADQNIQNLNYASVEEFNSFIDSLTIDWINANVDGAYYETLSNENAVSYWLMVGSALPYYIDINVEANNWKDFVTLADSNFEGSTILLVKPEEYTSENIVSKITEDANVGLHYVAYELTPSTTFDIDNYKDISVVDEKYYVVFTSDYLRNYSIGWQGKTTTAPLLIAPSTTLEMTDTTGIAGQDYSYVLTTTNVPGGVYQKVEATVKPTATTAGTYNFLDGTLIVTEYKVYTTDSEYYTITRQEDGSYKTTGATGGLTLGDFNVENINLYVDGELTLLGQEAYNKYEFSSSYLTASAGGSANLTANIIESVEGYELTINSATIEIDGSSQTIEVNGRNGRFYDSKGNFLFEIVGNGANPVLYATTYVKDVTIEVANLTPATNRKFIGILEWKKDDTSIYETALKTLQEFPTSKSVKVTLDNSTLNQAKAFNAIYTEAVYVTFSSISDKSISLTSGFVDYSIFVPIAGTTTLNDSGVNYDLYAFKSLVTPAGTSAEGKNLTVTGDKPVYNVQAMFGLNAPQISVDPSAWTLATKEGSYELDEFIDRIIISNDGTESGITYTYQWLKEGLPIESIDANTSNNGTYSVKVTANHANFNSVESNSTEFTITFTKSSVSLTAPETTSGTYKNASFLNDISFTYNLTNSADTGLNETKSLTLADLLALNSAPTKTIVTSIEKGGAPVSDIKDAGAYTIKFSWSSDTTSVYEFTGITEFTFTVSPESIELNKGNHSLSKNYGESDPDPLSVQVQGINETFTVVYENRGTGESVGPYNLNNPQSQNPNYTVSFPADDQGQGWFEIKKIDGLVLRAEVTGTVTHIYDGKTPDSVTVEDGSAGAVVLVIKSADQEWGRLTLSDFMEIPEGGSAGEPSTTIKASTFAGITFSVASASKNVGEYFITATGTTTTFSGGFIFENPTAAKFAISQKEVTLSDLTKEFDQTTSFDSRLEKHNVTISGLVGGEDLDLTATFASAEVTEDGASHALSDLTLVDGSNGLAGNYKIAEGSYTGTITKSSKVIEISFTNDPFVYGDISKTDLSAIVLDGKVDGASVYPTYVDFDVTITDATYSQGEFLNQGSWTIQVSPTSKYYTVNSTTFEITVGKKTITATADGEIVKDYDATTDVLQSFSLDALEGDAVLATATYASEMPGEDIEVTIALSGADSTNYILANSKTTGQINEIIITVNANINSISFVDGAQAIGQTIFEISYPFTESWAAEQAFALITNPSKTGYDFVKWTSGDKDFTAGTIDEIFETAITSRNIDITAEWKIQIFEVTVIIDDEQGSYTADPQGSVLNKVHTYDYWTTATFTGEAKNGYVLLSQPQTIQNISQNETVTISFRAARITFVVEADTSSLYPSGATVVYGGEGWTSSGTNAVKKVLSYTDLGELTANAFLPTTTLTGYKLASWKVGEKIISASDGAYTLAQLVADANSSFTSDIAIEIAPQFEANQHQISFDSNGGTPSSLDPITVTYGQEIGDQLPEVTQTGYNFMGWVYNGETYTTSTIYGLDEDITLVAEWGVGVFTLQVTTEHATVKVVNQDGDEIVSTGGGSYKLSHEDTYTITVQVEAGYSIGEWTNSEGFDFSLDENKLSATISNISKNGTLNIATEAKDNEINIIIDHATIDVVIGEDTKPSVSKTETGYKFNAKTGEVVKITIKPEEGYAITFVGTDQGKVTSEGNVYTLQNFTANTNLTFSAKANQFIANLVLDDHITGVEIISGGQNAGTGKIQVSTGEPLMIKPIFATGYELAQDGATATTGVSVSVDGGTGNITFSDFTNEFTITLTSSGIFYDMGVSFKAIDENNSVVEEDQFSVSTTPSGQAQFNTEITFAASMGAAEGYVFLGWFEGTLVEEDGILNLEGKEPVSTDLEYKFIVTGARDLTAVFKYSVFKIQAFVEGKGQIYKDSIEEGTLVADNEDNVYMSEEMFYNQTLTLVAKAKPGYEFDGWYIDGAKVTEGVTGTTFTTTISKAFDITAKFVAKEIRFDINPGVVINGILYDGESIEGLNFGKIEWSTDSEFTDPVATEDMPVITETDGKVYVRITNYAGYTFDSIYSALEGFDGQINEISKTENTHVFEITNLNADHEGGYRFVAKFVAETTTITLKFNDGNKQIEAGQIVVTADPGLSISGNSSSAVEVKAVTGSSLSVTASIYLGLEFADGSNPVKLAGGSGTIENQVTSTPDASTGWAQQVIFTVKDFTSGIVEVVINVKPKTYKVQLYNVALDGTTSLIGNTIEVEFGTQLEVPSEISTPERTGFTFTGFYAYVNGAGKQYLNADLVPNGNWTDTGYEYFGGKYVQSTNFDPITNTFSLYANYIINKTRITINAVPKGLENIDPTVAVKVVMDGLNESNSWTSSEESFYVDVREGANISVTAPSYENYKFAYWTITRTTTSGVQSQDKIYSETISPLSHDRDESITLEITYYAEVQIKVSGNGGTAYYTYQNEDGETISVDSSAYIPTTNNIMLYATPNAGYEFIGWYDAEGKLIGTTATYEVTASAENPLYATTYEARFDGQTMSIKIGEYDKVNGKITTVRVDGKEVENFESGFSAKIGQSIQFVIEKNDNFEVSWTGGTVRNLGGNNYFYRVTFDDSVDGVITLTPVISQKQCTVKLSIKMLDMADNSEASLAADVSYVDLNGQSVPVSVMNGATFNGLAGGLLELQFSFKPNYKIAKMLMNGVDVFEGVSEGNKVYITLTPNTITNLASIEIYFTRDLWVDYVSADYKLAGSGTDGDPYKISSQTDLAFVAYMINVENNTEYANAVYVVENNINMSGKYWSPIGTQDNKFNGKFYYRNHVIDGISVEYGYKGDLSQDKVFGYVSDEALIELNEYDYTLAIVIICIVIFLIILAVVIYLIIRRKRKKQLEELANS